MPKRRHPIRQLRDALSIVRGQRITQAIFARMLGVSASLINGLETKTSRVLSADLRERIAMRFGVHIDDTPPGRVICLIFPKLPLIDALRRYQEEQPAIEAGALRNFDERTVKFLRAALLAAHKKGKAVIFLDQLQAKTRALLEDLQVAAKLPEAEREIAASHGHFPADLTKDPLAETAAYANTLFSQGASRLRKAFEKPAAQ